MYLQGRCRLKFFSPIWSHDNENENKIEKKNAKFQKQENKMIWRYDEKVPFHQI